MLRALDETYFLTIIFNSFYIEGLPDGRRGKVVVSGKSKMGKDEMQGNQITAVANLAEVFGLLGSRVRLRILEIIADEEKCVNFLSEQLRLSQPTISYHLKLLFTNGLVRQHKTAQWVRYSLNKEELAKLTKRFSAVYGILDRPRGKDGSSSKGASPS